MGARGLKSERQESERGIENSPGAKEWGARGKEMERNDCFQGNNVGIVGQKEVGCGPGRPTVGRQPRGTCAV